MAKKGAFVYGCVKSTLFVLYKIFFRFEYFSAEKVPNEADSRGVILAPNHASFLDPPILGISLKRRVTYLAKDYLFKAFFIGWLLRSIGALPIKTEADDFRSIRELIRFLRAGKCIVVFPEGTRSPDGELQEPEGGVGFLAAKSEAWVVPVYIDGAYDAFPRDAKFFRCRKIKVYYGDPFIASRTDDYLAVGKRIMAEIKKLKDFSDSKR